MLIGKLKLKKRVTAYSVIDVSGFILGIELTIVRANDLRDKHRGSRVQMDQFEEDQLAELLAEQARRVSYTPPPVRVSEPVSQVIRSLTPVDGYDPLTMLSQQEIDGVVAKMRSLRMGTLPEVTDEELLVGGDR